MKFFYLSSNPNSNGLYEVHDRECDYIPNAYDRDYLGPYNAGIEALRKAKVLKKEVSLCEKCCNTKGHSAFSNLIE